MCVSTDSRVKSEVVSFEANVSQGTGRVSSVRGCRSEGRTMSLRQQESYLLLDSPHLILCYFFPDYANVKSVYLNFCPLSVLPHFYIRTSSGHSSLLDGIAHSIRVILLITLTVKVKKGKKAGADQTTMKIIL